jgi:tRNA U54 and U55 pseudouridine synthase Pus10
MIMRSGLLIAAVFGLSVSNPLTADDKPDEAGTHAKEAVEAYLKALRAEDVDAVMKVSGVPFVMNDRGPVGVEADLRKEFARLFKRSDMSKLKYELKAVGTIEEVNGELGEKKHEEKIRAVLKEGDRVVVAEADFGKRKETMSFVVTTRDGKVVVVGMFD